MKLIMMIEYKRWYIFWIPVSYLMMMVSIHVICMIPWKLLSIFLPIGSMFVPMGSFFKKLGSILTKMGSNFMKIGIPSTIIYLHGISFKSSLETNTAMSLNNLMIKLFPSPSNLHLNFLAWLSLLRLINKVMYTEKGSLNFLGIVLMKSTSIEIH